MVYLIPFGKIIAVTVLVYAGVYLPVKNIKFTHRLTARHVFSSAASIQSPVLVRNL